MKLRRTTVPLALLGCVAMLPGCVLSSHNATTAKGVKVSPHSLETLVVDQTTEADMLRCLGTPSRTMVADERGTIYVWEYTRRHESHGALLFVFGGSTEKEEQRSTSVLVRDGVVRSWWSG